MAKKGTMTTAEQIAAQFHDDGRCWTDGGGARFASVCEERCVAHHYSQAHQADRYTFADGSVITAYADGWDLGYPGCYCWQGEGHTEGCAEWL